MFPHKWSAALPMSLYPPVESSSEDCDCACEVSLPQTGTVPTLKGLWQHAAETRPLDKALPDGWHAVIHPSGPTPLAVLNEAAWSLWERYLHPAPLLDDPVVKGWAQRGFLRPVHQGEPSLTSEPPSSRAQRLTAWVHLTNACNLACPYCYVRKTPEHMSWEVGRRVIDMLVSQAQHHGYHRLKLKYAGGEPLLRFSFLQRLHAYATTQAQQAGVELEAVVISNGTRLLPAYLDYFRQTGIALAVSVDGLGAVHDRQRPFRNGKGSFDIVARNLIRARQAGVDLNVNITLTDWNLDGLPDLVAWLLRERIPFSLNFYRENEGAQGYADLPLQNQRLIQALKRVYRVIEQHLPPWSLLGRLTDRGSATTAHSLTCAAGHDYLVIDHQGRVTTCQMLLGKSFVTHIEHPDPLSVLRRRHPFFQNLPVDQKEPCNTCSWRYWCTGGCPLMTFRMTGRFDVRSPLCEVYQTIYPEVLRLEALRLIRYAQI